MDPTRLRLLRELGDRGSVAAVATALHVSASAVSQQITALQRGIPVPLTVKQERRPVPISAFHSAALALFGPLLTELGDGPRISLADADVTQDKFAGLTAD